ncbi:hypothetical protein HDU96_007275 [Phlyctochytrium bullatum]|nr:hypothetical protein HDU96_007275 [Phlyctochytrium bullatum]
MLLTVNLFWLIFAIPATFLFAYVSSSGLYLLISAARSIPRVRLIQGGILISLLFGTYAACFTPAPRRSLSMIMDFYRSLPLQESPLGAFLTPFHQFAPWTMDGDDAATSPAPPAATSAASTGLGAAATSAWAASVRKNWFRLPLPDIVQQTTGVSHALCLGLGLFVVQWVSTFIAKMKGRGVDEYQYSFIESFLGIIFHLKFFLGTFLWYRYFLMPISRAVTSATTPPPHTLPIVNDAFPPAPHPGASPTESDLKDSSTEMITTLGASILGLSHTLAFSIGFFIHHDYHSRSLDKRTESEVMRYYLSFAGVLVAGRLAFQAICDATGLDPTSHDILLLSAAISCFILLNNKSYSLMNYFWLPLAAGLLSVIPALDSNPLVAFLMPYVSHNRELLALALVGAAGFILGVRWALQPLLSSLGTLPSSNSLGIASSTTTATQSSATNFDPVHPIVPPPTSLAASAISPAAQWPAAVDGVPLADTPMQRQRARKFPPPFPNGWYRIASVEEVKPGQVRLVTALGRSFAVFRGEDDGAIGVVDAMCPHLGANMAVGGRVVGNSLECPFHGWRFDKTGKCVDIPYATSIPEVARAKTWPSREVAGLVCIWFDAEGRAPFYEPRPFPLEEKQYYSVATRTASLPMHIQDFAENAADWMHFGKVHSRLALPFLDRFLYIKHRTRWSPSTGDDGSFTNDQPPYPIADNEDPNSKYLRASDADEAASVNAVLAADPTIHHFTFFDVPSLHSVFSDRPLPSGNVHARVEFTGQGGIVYFRFSTPYGEVTAVKTFLPLSGSAASGLLLHMRDDVYAERSVPFLLAKHIWNEAAHAFDDDIFLWTNKTYFDRPLLVKEDRPIKKFREFYKRNYSANSRTFAYEGLEW